MCAAITIAALVTTTGCSAASVGSDQTVAPTETVCPGNSTNVSIPQFDGFGGQRSPIAAAVYFSKHGNVGDVPSTGWKIVVQTKTGAYLRSGASIIHTVHASDGTWLVDSEQTCRS
jgi:hypothetical protein